MEVIKHKNFFKKNCPRPKYSKANLVNNNSEYLNLEFSKQ